MLALLALLSAGVWFSGSKTERVEMPPQQNPSELKSALFFGLLYAVALFAVTGANTPPRAGIREWKGR